MDALADDMYAAMVRVQLHEAAELRRLTAKR
jgi:hypothetical protein